MKKLAIGVLAVLLTALPLVMADTFPTGANPGNIEPKVYLVEKGFDWGLNGPMGGSTPDGFDIQLDGSVTPSWFLRRQEYAFTGEQVAELIVARDLNGAADLSYAKVTVDTYTEALCMELVPQEEGDSWFVRFLGETVFLDDVPPADNAADEAGFDPAFDKVYKCLWTVEPQWYGQAMVNIDVYDQSGASSRDGIAQTWFFNPVIMIDLETNNGAPSVEFEEGVPGETVYSLNKLVITNLAEGAVDLRTWIGASDFTDPAHSGALCPISNVLDTDAMYRSGGNLDWGLEYRGKKGTYLGDWHPSSNKDPADGCTFEAGVDHSGALTGNTCHGLQDVVWGGETWVQVLENMHSEEVEFRLTYPVPCIGDFTDGSIYVIVKAV
jgi:hypothetical protein